MLLAGMLHVNAISHIVVISALGGDSMKPIAHIRTDFSTKFGVPRQAGLVPELRATVLFEEEYRDPDALRGLDGFSHLWLIWEFSEAKRDVWSPTVRPPRLGGNTRLGVFATRSPFRPNPIGLSCVKLEGVAWDHVQGPMLLVSGADLMDGTPIFDIKPYIPYTDCRPEATEGFTAPGQDYLLEVDIPDQWRSKIPAEKLSALRGVLAQDPRPPYQNDPDRVYGFGFAGLEVKFKVADGRLTVCGVAQAQEDEHGT
jgi:tRNA-Thr(GGU) m(6)t(6)A37 methyltransferase TsaA